MNETLQHDHIPVPEMPPLVTQPEANELAQFDPVAAAEQILADTPAPEAPQQPEAAANPVEFNANMLRLFMLTQGEEARKMLAGAIALDLVGQQHGVKEFTFANAAAAQHRFESERALADLRKQQEESEE